jgi:hypothetical protein
MGGRSKWRRRARTASEKRKRAIAFPADSRNVLY